MFQFTSSRLRRSLCVVLAAIALGGIAISCKSDSDPGASGQLSDQQQLRIRIEGDPSSFDPQLASFTEEISIAKQLFRGLFTYDKNLDVVPAIALELPTKANGGISDDGLTYTIKMRNDATWSDGQPVTAHDFVYAFKRLFDPDAGAQGYYFSFYTAIEGADAFAGGDGTADGVQVSAPDDYTVVIKLAHPQPTLPTLLALWPASPLRQDLIEKYGDSWTEPGKLVGDGPFVLSDYSPEDEIVLAGNAAYWGNDRPTLDRIEYRIIPEDSAAVIAYENGEIDLTNIPTADSARFADDPERITFGQLETYALQYNDAQPPFDDPLVRRAFSRAIDRDAFISVVRGGVGFSTTSWLPPNMLGGNTSIGSEHSFNVDAARSLLGQAGFENGNGFPTVTITIADDATNRLTAEFLQGQLKQNLGIDVQIETLDENAYYDRYNAGDFEMTWSSWFADYGDPENWLPEQFASDGAFNVFGYSNPQVDDLLSRAAGELDEGTRIDLYDQAHRLVIDDQALTPIFNPERNYLVKANVADLVTTALDAVPGDWFVTDVRIMASAAPASDPE